MSLITIIMLILAFLGLAFVSGESNVAVSTVTVATSAVEEPAEGWTLVDTDGIEGVIVAPDDVSGFGLEEPYWAPTVADVASAEAAIAEEEGPLDHQRQYAGFTEDGERKILVNGFCSDEPYWTHDIVFIMDGGECYFTGIYNVDTAELESFSFNGDA